MSEERASLDDVDPEEERAAAALSRALDGGSADAHLPLAALEAAALLRYSADAGQLNGERQAKIREEVLGSLSRSAAPRSRAWAWLSLGLPVLAGASLVGVLWLAATQERPEHTTASAEDGMIPGAADPAPRLVGQLAQAAAEYRAGLVRSLKSDALERVHALGDRALLDRDASRTEVEHAQQALAELARAPAEGHWSATETRQVRQDLFCRLAEAALRLGQPEAALDWARQGLALDGPPTPFLAQLSALEGQAKAALGDRLGAAQSYMQALKVNQALLDESLGGAE